MLVKIMGSDQDLCKIKDLLKMDPLPGPLADYLNLHNVTTVSYHFNELLKH